jgi:hypothetical protein
VSAKSARLGSVARSGSCPFALIEIQSAWLRADRACHASGGTGKAARAERLNLTMRKVVLAAPWRSGFKAYDRWRADEALKQYVRGLPEFAPEPPMVEEVRGEPNTEPPPAPGPV